MNASRSVLCDLAGWICDVLTSDANAVVLPPIGVGKFGRLFSRYTFSFAEERNQRAKRKYSVHAESCEI